jgi:hypothetical protein
MTTDARAVLEAYAEVPNMNVIPLPFTPRSMAPLAFTALAAVLDLADHYDDLGDRMWTESAAEDIRRAITTALEAS